MLTMKRLLIVFAIALTCFAAKKHDDKRTIPAGSKIYVNSNNGFEIFIQAAFQSKHVKAVIVSTPEQADYILESSIFHAQEATATQKIAGTYILSEAAFKLTSKSGEVIWAYAATKGPFSHGPKQAVAEACAKHLKEIIR
jgi:hypothetical protein